MINKFFLSSFFLTLISSALFSQIFSNHSVFICTSDSSIRGWGSNTNGELGDGTSGNNIPAPVQPFDLSGMISVKAGSHFTIGLKSDSTVWAWGYNIYGNLGDSGNVDKSIPVQVHGPNNVGFLTGIKKIAVGYYHVLALKGDGTVWAWGYNGNGQLGDGTTINQWVPVQVSGLTNVAFLSGGANFSMALKNDGTVWTWGYNGYGQLGDNTTAGSYTPIQVHGFGNVGFLTGIIAITAGSNHSIALKNDATVWSWGYNGYGQLGNNLTSNSYTPIQVHGQNNVGFLTGIIALSAGDIHSVALKNDATVWSWGYNAYGQMGDGTNIDRHTPVPANGLTGITTIYSGDHHSYALKNDNTIWSWGNNGNYQLGNGDNMNKNTPVQATGPCAIPPMGVVTFSVTPSTCFGNCSGTATAFPSGGAPPYSFLWSNSQISQTANGLCATDYTVTVTDYFGAVTTGTVTSTEPAVLSYSFTSTTNISCYGQNDGSATVTANGGISPYTYSWNGMLPNQTTATATSLLANTAYSVNIYDANGCFLSTGNIYLLQPNPVNANYTSSSNGQTVTFTNTSTDAVSYLWNFGDGNTSTQTNPVYTYNFGGAYNVCLISYSSCSSDTFCQTIFVNCTPPVANYSTSVSGLTVTFTNISTNASNVIWNFGDATSSNVFSPVHTYSASGTYSVCLIVSNGCGNDTFCQNINVICAIPSASFTTGISGLTVNFTNTSTNAASSSWDFGDLQTSAATDPTHVYFNSGTYNVQLIVSNSCGTDTIVSPVTVNCISPVASYVFNPQGLSVDFVSTSTNAASVKWTFGDGSPFSILPFVTHTYTTTGTYFVCLIATNGCGADTLCDSVSVCMPPNAGFTSSVSALNVAFTNTSTNGINYYWTFGDAYATNQQNPLHTYGTSGTYNVCLVAQNSCGSDTVCANVVITCSQYTVQPVCMITVDSTSTYNLLVWEKPVTTDIDSFRIYREISSVFSPIVTVPYSSLSEYLDTTVGVNPNITSYKYKLSLIDTCGTESILSAFHQTIHLSVSPALPCGYALSWNDYIGFPITQYRILRDSAFTGWMALDSVSFGNNAWNDIICYSATDTVSYLIEIDHPNGCLSSLKNPQTMATNFNSSKSNIYKIADTTVTSVMSVSDNNNVLIYPNPNNGFFSIEMKENPSRGEVKIYDVIGEEVKEFSFSDKTKIIQIDLKGYAKGVYQLQIVSGNNFINRKLIIR